MAALCSTCGCKRNHSSHLRAVAGAAYHPYLDPSKGGLKPKSDARVAYEQSAAHKDALALAAGAKDCWPAAYGAPGECYGKIGPSHSLSSGAHGGLPEADKYPAPPACTAHNDGMEQDPEMREWAETHMFVWNGRQWPFKITNAFLQAEKERRI